MPSTMWDQITYPFPNFNGCTVEVWEWISNFIPHFIRDVITYPCRNWMIFVGVYRTSVLIMSWTSKHADDLRTAYQWVRSYTLHLILKIRTFCPSLHKLIKDDTRCPFYLQHNEPKSGTVNSRILTAKRLLEFIPGIMICIVGRFFPFFLEANHRKYSQNMWCT